MLTILHGSDLHFGAYYDPVAGEAFLDAARTSAPDLIVISGDLTQRAKVREYEEAKAYIARFPEVPLVVVPGNHDVPLYRVFERLFAPYRNYCGHIARELNTVTRIDGAMVVALNSAAPHRAIVNGRLRAEQVEFASRAFAGAAADDVRIVVVHHHLASPPDYEAEAVFPGAREILDAFEGMGVEVILGGHLHRGYVGHSSDVRRGADGEGGIVIVQSGTTTSRRGRARERGKNGFNLLRLEDGHVEILRFVHFEDRGAFLPVSIHTLPRRKDRFLPGKPSPARFRWIPDSQGE